MAKKTDQTNSMLGGDEELSEQLPEQTPANDSPVAAAPPAAAQPEGLPYCARHNCRMKAVSSPEKLTYYQCPVPRCGESAKRLRQASKIPSDPQACPSSLCAKRSESDRSYLEVIPAKSQLSKLWMECPQCGFSVQQPRPAFTGHVPRTGDDLSAR